MNMWYQRWADAPPSRRVLCWSIASAIVALAIWGLLLRPAYIHFARIQAQAVSAGRINAMLWPGALRQPVVAQVRGAYSAEPFSPLALQGEGARLVHWKPRQSGGELALDASWQAVPALFSRLARKDVRISTFDIAPQGTQLRLSLQLETGHAR